MKVVFHDKDVEDCTLTELECGLIELLHDLLAAADESDMSNEQQVYHTMMVLKTAASINPADMPEMPADEQVAALIGAVMQRLANDPESYSEICESFERGIDMFDKPRFVTVYRKVAQAAKGDEVVLCSVANLLAVISDVDLESCSCVSEVCEEVRRRMENTRIDRNDVRDLCEAIDLYVESLLIGIYNGSVDHETAWFVLSEMLVEIFLSDQVSNMASTLIHEPFMPVVGKSVRTGKHTIVG